MNNLPAHKAACVREAIENAFSQLEALMRAKAESTTTVLWNAAGSLVDHHPSRMPELG